MPRVFQTATTLLGLLVLVCTLSACDITEKNDNPNSPEQADPGYLLTAALTGETNPTNEGLASAYWDDFYSGRFGILYAQYWSENQYTSESRYQYRTSIANGFWEDFYISLNNLEEIKRLNRTSPELYTSLGPPENQIAIAKIMQMWAFQVLADTYGAVPFNEALEGSENSSPAYTPLEEMYPAMIDSLSQAVEALDTSAPTFPSADVVFGGDVEKWKRFGNSLKMRIAMRMADRLPDQAATAIEDAIASGPMQSNADNATVQFLSSAPYQNPYYVSTAVNGRDDWAVSDRVVTHMQSTNDPRLASYARPAPGGGYEGFPYGLTEGEAQSLYQRGNFSRPAEALYSADAPCIFMLYDETEFIKAEAVERGFISGSAPTFLEAGIRGSMEYWEVEDASAIDAYVTSALDRYDSGDFEQFIGEEKWVALYMQGFQGWSEWRRLDFEGILEAPESGPLYPSGVVDYGIALRFVYPRDEASLNGDNLEAAINNFLGGDGADSDNQGVQLWWDVDPPPAL